MSDNEIIIVLDEMETMINSGIWNSEELAAWKAKFEIACLNASRGPDWPKIIERAHRISHLIDDVVEGLMQESKAIKNELGSYLQGSRALKAYKPTE